VNQTKGECLVDSFLTAEECMRQKQNILDVQEFVTKACLIWSQKRFDCAPQFFSSQMKFHVGVKRTCTNFEHFLKSCNLLHECLENVTWRIDDIVVEGSMSAAKVALRYKIEGKWVKEFCGNKPNEQEVITEAISLWHIKNSLVAEIWCVEQPTDGKEWIEAWRGFYENLPHSDQCDVIPGE